MILMKRKIVDTKNLWTSLRKIQIDVSILHKDLMKVNGKSVKEDLAIIWHPLAYIQKLIMLGYFSTAKTEDKLLAAFIMNPAQMITSNLFMGILK